MARRREAELASVELVNVAMRFAGGIEALVGVDLAVAEGDFLVILGPSGSGKSTLLRLVAGLDSPSSGSIRIDGRPAAGLAPRDRGVGMVFQDPAPYPHLNVFENLAFGLRARRVPAAEIAAKVGETAALLRLADCLDRRPATLSGGQRQRVALGRSLARRPGLLLLDEPLSNLDAPLRASIRGDLLDLHRRLGTTTILVTHDQAEALALGDRVAVLDRGRLAQVGPPGEVHDRPASRFVAGFLGFPPMSFLGGSIEAAGGSLLVRTADVAAAVPDDAPWAAPLRRRGPGPLEIGLRAEQLRPIGKEEVGDTPGFLDLWGLVDRLEFAGHEVIATLDARQPAPLRMRLAPGHPLRVGQALAVRLDLSRASWFDPEGRRLA